MLGDLLAASLALLLTCLLTGALHEDGLADTADALGGGGADRDRVLAILKDSRHGSYGVLALIGSLLIRVAALERLGAAAPVAWLLAAVLARSAVVWLMARLPYVTAGRRRPQRRRRPGRDAPAGGGDAAGAGDRRRPAAARPGRTGCRCPPRRRWRPRPWASALATAGAGWLFRRRVGGITGDFLGAAEQVERSRRSWWSWPPGLYFKHEAGDDPGRQPGRSPGGRPRRRRPLPARTRRASRPCRPRWTAGPTPSPRWPSWPPDWIAATCRAPPSTPARPWGPPLPRAYEWLDGSAFLHHVRLARRSRGAEIPPELETDPLMYQGGSGVLLGPTDPLPFADPALGLDFEAEIAVILGDVPRGVDAAAGAASRSAWSAC